VVPVVTSRIDGRLYAVVSVNTFENVEPALLRRSPSTFEGENEQARLSRRKRNWIADVHFDARAEKADAEGAVRLLRACKRLSPPLGRGVVHRIAVEAWRRF
jgi:hypothetical protein